MPSSSAKILPNRYMEIDHQALPGPHRAGADDEHRLGERAGEIGSERHPERRETARDVGAADRERDVLGHVRDAAAGQHVRPQLPLRRHDELEAGHAEGHRLLDLVRHVRLCLRQESSDALRRGTDTRRRDIAPSHFTEHLKVLPDREPELRPIGLARHVAERRLDDALDITLILSRRARRRLALATPVSASITAAKATHDRIVSFLEARLSA